MAKYTDPATGQTWTEPIPPHPCSACGVEWTREAKKGNMVMDHKLDCGFMRAYRKINP